MAVPDHQIHLSRTLALPALAEWVSLLIGGKVVGQRVESEQFVIEVNAAAEADGAVLDLTNVDQPYWDAGRLSTYPLGESQGLPPLYTLCLGLYRAGANVQLESPWVTYLPHAGRLTHDDALASPPTGGLSLPFVPNWETHVPLDPAQLAEIHGALAGAGSFAECGARTEFRRAFPGDQVDPEVASEFVLQHRSGLRVQVAMTSEQEILSHQIIEQELSPEQLVALRPRSLGRAIDRHCWLDRAPDPIQARTFGEAVIGLVPKGDDQPTAFAVWFDEVAIIEGTYFFHRFHIEDRRTLDSLALLPLGEGCSKLYPAAEWAAWAQAFEWQHQWEPAAACWEQARRLGGTPDEVAHYELQLEYCQGQPAREAAEAVQEAAEAAARAERIRKIREQTSPGMWPDYVARLPPELRANFRAAIEQVEDRHEFCHDFKLGDTDLGPPARGEGEWRVELAWFDMPVVWLTEVGVPPAVLDYRCGCDPRRILTRWIEIRCGPHCLWTDTRGWYVDPYEPTALYLYLD